MDFDSLVNEILGMAKESAEERKKNAGKNPNISWDDTPAGESYWKDIRSRNTQLEVGKQTDLGVLARQRLASGGTTDATGNDGQKNYGSFMTEMVKNDPTIFTDPKRKGELDNMISNMRDSFKSVQIPTPGDKAAAVYGDMSNSDFKKTVNDPNSQQPTGGFGYIEGVNPKDKVNFTRVLGDSVTARTSIPLTPKELGGKVYEVPPLPTDRNVAREKLSPSVNPEFQSAGMERLSNALSTARKGLGAAWDYTGGAMGNAMTERATKHTNLGIQELTDLKKKNGRVTPTEFENVTRKYNYGNFKQEDWQ
jgi:hypothetical protein